MFKTRKTQKLWELAARAQTCGSSLREHKKFAQIFSTPNVNLALNLRINSFNFVSAYPKKFKNFAERGTNFRLLKLGRRPRGKIDWAKSYKIYWASFSSLVHKKRCLVEARLVLCEARALAAQPRSLRCARRSEGRGRKGWLPFRQSSRPGSDSHPALRTRFARSQGDPHSYFPFFFFCSLIDRTPRLLAPV